MKLSPKIIKSNFKTFKQIFESAGFTPTKLLKGDPIYAQQFQLKLVKRKRYSIESVLFEGMLKNKPVVLKIYSDPTKGKSRFQKEFLVYYQFRNELKAWHNITSEPFSYGLKPIPYLIISKVSGKVLGDWFHVYNQSELLYKSILSNLKVIYQKTNVNSLEKDPKFTKIAYFLNKTAAIKKTLTYLDQSYWFKYLELGAIVRNNWQLVENTFIFKDFNPANIIIVKKGIKFIDFDSVSVGKKHYDYAFFYFAATASPIQKYLYTEIVSEFNIIDLTFFVFFYYYFVLSIGNNFIKHQDPLKFKGVIRELDRLLTTVLN